MLASATGHRHDNVTCKNVQASHMSTQPHLMTCPTIPVQKECRASKPAANKGHPECLQHLVSLFSISCQCYSLLRHLPALVLVLFLLCLLTLLILILLLLLILVLWAGQSASFERLSSHHNHLGRCSFAGGKLIGRIWAGEQPEELMTISHQWATALCLCVS